MIKLNTTLITFILLINLIILGCSSSNDVQICDSDSGISLEFGSCLVFEDSGELNNVRGDIEMAIKETVSLVNNKMSIENLTIRIRVAEEILGLLSLKDIKDELRIHINLIEISEKNRGQGKKYDRIAGCLIAYACELSFDKSYDGFVSLVPKTRLINHYCKHYGFEQYGRQLGLGYEASINLIKKYL